MPVDDITVRFCNPRKEGKKNATIKTNDGQLYLVSPELYPAFKEGGRYKVSWHSQQYDKTTFRIVDTVDVADASPVAKHQAGKYGGADDITAERIFVCGAFNAMLNNPNSTAFAASETDLTERVKALRAVWNNTFGKPGKREDLDDEQPF